MSSSSQVSRVFSLELFPAKTEEGFARLKNSVSELLALQPEFFSVTFGAGGSTRDRTFEVVEWLHSQGIKTAPHISCIGANREEIKTLLSAYQRLNINRLVALRGDLPSGAGPGSLGALKHANELVAFIREHFADQFHIEVAAYPEYHPQASSPEADLINFKKKIDAGANSAITQYFFNPDAYFQFVERCQSAGIDIPIVPGIMPITNYSSLARFSDTCGAEIPRWIRKKLEAYHDDLESIRAFGIEVVSRLCQNLLDNGAPGLHFYTMNQSAATLKIWNNLN